NGIIFSSRRRHTRSKRDWSSDVCSSDLKPVYPPARKKVIDDYDVFIISAHFFDCLADMVTFTAEHTMLMSSYSCAKCLSDVDCKIGRASCRERVQEAEDIVSVYRETRKK